MYPIDFLWRSVRRFPDRMALFGDNREITYRELARMVLAQASALLALEPTPGGRVALGAANSVEHLVALLAIMAAGKTWIPLNVRNGDPELFRIIAYARPALVLADDEM